MLKSFLTICSFAFVLSVYASGIVAPKISVKDAYDSSTVMSSTKMETLLNLNATIIEGKKGYWKINYKGRYMLIMADESHNRVRVLTPVVEHKKLKKDDLFKALEMQFNKDLFARYAVYQDYLWSVYSHPMKELTPMLLLDAMEQVKVLADSYTSNVLHSS